MAYGMSKIALEHMTVSLAAQLVPFGIAVNTFRIDVAVASEGFIANLPDVDHSTWEPTDVAAEGILWMLRQPPTYTGKNEGMADLREREGIMASKVAQPTRPSPGLNTVNPMTILDTTAAPVTGCPRERAHVTERRASRATRNGSRVYRAETPLPSSPLPGLAACAAFADRVVGSLWWQARFPELGLSAVPRLRPGNGARQAFFREDDDGPTITLPRRYRTKGVVLHELSHWALHRETDLPHHGDTFVRVLLDATVEFCGSERADALASLVPAAPRTGRPARDRDARRAAPVYGWDERLRLGRGRTLTVRFVDGDGARGRRRRHVRRLRAPRVDREAPRRRRPGAGPDPRRCSTCPTGSTPAPVPA